MSDSLIDAEELAGDQGDGFLGRWSRLKTAPESVAEPLSVDAKGELSTLEQWGEQPVVEAELEPEPLTDADMPDIESLNEQSDFSGFLSEKVSEQLRQKALKKLFHLPEFNIRDGLNEYDDDYSKFIPLGDTVTYQMKQFVERQKQAFNDALEGEEGEGEEQSDSAQGSLVAVDSQVEAEDCALVRSSSVDAAAGVDGIEPELVSGGSQSQDDQEEDDLGACE